MSLAYSPSKRMLYVVHSFGPDHVRLMSVSSDGKLTPRVSMWILFPPGTLIWKRRCGTIAALNDQAENARREVDRRGKRGSAAEKLRGFRFSFA